MEQSNGGIKEYNYTGNFVIDGGILSLTLQGEYDDDETDEITLLLKK